jgi:hypothetical protein
VEAGGHHDGVDRPAGRSGTQMLLLFDDLYPTEGMLWGSRISILLAANGKQEET